MFFFSEYYHCISGTKVAESKFSERETKHDPWVKPFIGISCFSLIVLLVIVIILILYRRKCNGKIHLYTSGSQ